MVCVNFATHVCEFCKSEKESDGFGFKKRIKNIMIINKHTDAYMIQLTDYLTHNFWQHLDLSYDINKNEVSYTECDTQTSSFMPTHNS
jgi:hypothetical protein